MIAHSIIQSCPPETKTLRDLLLGTGFSNAKTALSNAAVTRTYTVPQYVPVVGDTHRYVPFSNVVTTTCKFFFFCYVTSIVEDSFLGPYLMPHVFVA